MSQAGNNLNVEKINIDSIDQVSGTSGLTVDNDRKLYLDGEIIGPRTLDVGSLQDVTSIGNTTTNNIEFKGNLVQGINNATATGISLSQGNATIASGN